MEILKGIKRQLRSVIQWENPSPDQLLFRWTENGDEIKNASKLIVGPGQACIFVYEGKVEAINAREGLVDLKTANIPFWTTITKFMQSFVSEHKVGIYFLKTTKILNQKWGTASPIKYEDPRYKFPVSLRAYGNYSFQLTDPSFFFSSISGAVASYSLEDFRAVMSSRILQPLSDFFAESGYSYTEIDVKREELAQGICAKLEKDFAALGFTIADFRIEGTSFDEDTMKRINRIADVNAESQAARAAGLNYAQLQQLEAMREAARNEGGAAGLGMSIGAGVGLGQMMAGAMDNIFGQHSNEDYAVRLATLKKMLDAGLIQQSEFDAKKIEILSKI